MYVIYSGKKHDFKNSCTFKEETKIKYKIIKKKVFFFFLLHNNISSCSAFFLKIGLFRRKKTGVHEKLSVIYFDNLK